MFREVLLASLLLGSAFTGCIGQTGQELSPQATDDPIPDRPVQEDPGDDDPEETGDQTANETEGSVDNTTQTIQEDPLAILEITDDDRLRIEVPVHIAMVGFPGSTSQAVADRLEKTPVDHQAYDSPRLLHGQGTEATAFPAPSFTENPVLPVAVPQVHHLDEDLAEAYRQHLEANEVDGTQGTIYDADAAERWLADQLREQGVPVDPDTPTLVLIHTGQEGKHAYRYTYTNGYLEPVRAFGGQQPILALDASAFSDPWVANATGLVCTEGTDVQPTCELQVGESWDRALPATGTATVDALEGAIDAAIQYRLLQGPLYPVADKPCYAVTVVLGVEETAPSQASPVNPSAEALLNGPLLDQALSAAVAPMTLHLDTTVLSLPADDPELAAIAETEDAELVREWMIRHWEDHWVAHDGCEAVVSFHLFGDASQGGDWGIAMMDRTDGYRVSLSVTAGLERFQETYTGPASGEINDRESSRSSYRMVDMLVAHETGHLLGLRHPHDITTTDPGDDQGTIWTFSSTLTAMSYQTEDRTWRFGEIDQTNLQRNRAGVLLQAAIEDDLDGTPGYQEALLQLAEHDWDKASQTLQGLVDG